ncbi:hypothetical protein KC345_g11152 [Hortaea werneckii]|nr:hypothetical protein KC345_g11152 [Hortaea werneckii]
MAELLIFAGINGLLVYVLHPMSNPLLISLSAAGLLVTYFLVSGMHKQLLPYRSWILLIHMLLGVAFYLLFGMLLMGKLIVTYNLNMTNQYDILYFVYGQDRAVVYGLLLIMLALYFVIGKLMMRPLYSWYARSTYKASRVNIRLTGGEIISGVYLVRNTDRHSLLASDSLNPLEATKSYKVNRDKVEYIETVSPKY